MGTCAKRSLYAGYALAAAGSRRFFRSPDRLRLLNRTAGTMLNWLVFHDPFTFITFWVYFTCATASVRH